MSAPSWQRPASEQHAKFCAIVAYVGGSSVSACGGRWETCSTLVLIGVDVRELECGGCRDALAEAPIAKAPRCDCGSYPPEHTAACQSLAPIRAALRELRNAPAIRTEELHTASGVLFEGFDVSDSERDA